MPLPFAGKSKKAVTPCGANTANAVSEFYFLEFAENPAGKSFPL